MTGTPYQSPDEPKVNDRVLFTRDPPGAMPMTVMQVGVGRLGHLVMVRKHNGINQEVYYYTLVKVE